MITETQPEHFGAVTVSANVKETIMIAPATYRYDIKQGRTVKAPSIPEALLPVADVASGYYVRNDGVVDFAVYGRSARSRQVKDVVAAIEAAGYVASIIVAPRLIGLRGIADGQSAHFGVITALQA